jgi:hypothetical protein
MLGYPKLNSQRRPEHSELILKLFIISNAIGSGHRVRNPASETMVEVRRRHPSSLLSGGKE